eukprot:CAMPEP_0194520642 /NCGR_PEP_ID=MMETSP0253-20130528/54710_1 /TAXON_ID=2966 /ORGANISM="Noctiluca scintillans" /LENGTH=342 /DNA_ID=CAMNT_0039364911 /DNA_START=1 /DNA_END=1029 /DNA_ORIENTATION=-
MADRSQSDEVIRWPSSTKARAAFLRVGPVLSVVLACSCFMVVGPTLMLLNKHIMEDFDFPYPITLCGIGVLSSACVAKVAVMTGFAHIRPATLDALHGKYFYIVFSFALMKALTLACGNAVYLHLSVGLIQMLKAMTPSIVLVVMYFSSVELPPSRAVWCLVLITFGTIAEVKGELGYEVGGLLLMTVSCTSEAVSMVMSQKMLQNLKFSEIETMYFLSPPTFFIICVPAALWEWGSLLRNTRYLVFMEHPLEMLAAASLGMVVTLLGFLTVRLTSSITVKILNTGRCVGLVFIGMIFYGEHRSVHQLMAYGVSLLGFLGYNFFTLSHRKQLVATSVDKDGA